ncbi:MAG TPA: ribosome biogenesis GTP-binding protein YihA/YsxC [Vicinamibacterales bacterium]|nr:ribosome biogenesis GTP-binding protein YihA/YsxC [Vicinamibacterales bacterium]HOG28570.1 ribosome biogenesis GTP-binding protein YihA/YsxC [Vicinamibacterales bacterium]HOQ61572.1 ribosome biogenesis GTP-binding protein YihA/YsxC [Vicinamibacterales bacterium]HPK71853.1 ribosome biogenesis GTP-binding protein YihA/YsxC [Vicinamibacterales bacterium]HPW19930.1 ribosome biogenesis GTP-binding protein YihA/YsxC [Vicinamibacterales bacterium]
MARAGIVAAEFVTSVAAAAGLPQSPLAEVALVGRSNVGKSSLLNALAGRTIARTSAAPGKTRLANFYRLEPRRGTACHVVDLPGYGYARGAGDGRPFEPLARDYFFGGRAPDRLRGAIAAAVLLADARHPGLDADLGAAAWLTAHGCPYQVAAAKADKLSRGERQRAAESFARAFGRDVLMLSARTGEGLESLWTWIAQQVEQWTQRRP